MHTSRKSFLETAARIAYGPEAKMEAVPLYDAESEKRCRLQDKALELLPDELVDLFRDPESIREAVCEMSDTEIKALLTHADIWRACWKHFQPIAWESAQKRAEDKT